MTESATAPQSVDYAGPPPGEPRPTSVSVLAGIGIVFGTLFVFCKPVGLAVQLFVPLPQSNPVIDLFRNDPTLRAFAVFSTLTGTLLSLLLLLSSLGSLALKPWARTGMFGYAALAILMTLVEQVVGVYVVGPEVERAMRQSGMPQPPGMGWMSGWIGVALGVVLKLWYPVLILVYYLRANVKLAFERGLPGKGI